MLLLSWTNEISYCDFINGFLDKKTEQCQPPLLVKDGHVFGQEYRKTRLPRNLTEKKWPFYKIPMKIGQQNSSALPLLSKDTNENQRQENGSALPPCWTKDTTENQLQQQIYEHTE